MTDIPDIRTILTIMEGARRTSKPYIDAHRSGDIIWIDMMEVPQEQRRKGIGRTFYERWEAKLPRDITLLRLMAADTGTGLSNAFWEAMGFNYTFRGDNLDYDSRQYMWKGVNGHPTPPTVDAEDEDEGEDEDKHA